MFKKVVCIIIVYSLMLSIIGAAEEINIPLESGSFDDVKAIKTANFNTEIDNPYEEAEMEIFVHYYLVSILTDRFYKVNDLLIKKDTPKKDIDATTTIKVPSSAVRKGKNNIDVSFITRSSGHGISVTVYPDSKITLINVSPSPTPTPDPTPSPTPTSTPTPDPSPSPTPTSTPTPDPTPSPTPTSIPTPDPTPDPTPSPTPTSTRNGLELKLSPSDPAPAPTPTLIVSPIQFEKEPSANEPSLLNFKISNTGNGQSSNLSILLLINQQRINEMQIPLLAPGQSIPISFNWIPAPGNQKIGIQVVSGKEVLSSQYSSVIIEEPMPKINFIAIILFIIVTCAIIYFSLKSNKEKQKKSTNNIYNKSDSDTRKTIEHNNSKRIGIAHELSQPEKLETISQQVKLPIGKEKILVDGSNVAHVLSKNDPKISYIESVRSVLEQKNFEPLIFVDASLRHKISIEDKKVLEKLREDRKIIQANGVKADIIMLHHANKYGLKIVSNDHFKEYKDLYPWLNDHGRVVPINIVGSDLYLEFDRK